MKPVFASRETRCNSCGEPIEAGAKRIDETLRNPKTVVGVPFLRLHYHLSCYIKKLEKWFETHTPIRRQGAGGRPQTLDLTPDQKLERRRILAKLSALQDYYIPRLNIQAKDITELSPQDLRRFQTFYTRRTEYLKALEQVGGIPDKYQQVVNPTITSILPKPVEVLTDGLGESEDWFPVSDETQAEEVAIETTV